MASDTGAPWLLPYPEDTDLVRDGASDIEALAVATASGLSAASVVKNIFFEQMTAVQSFTGTGTFQDLTGLSIAVTPESTDSEFLVESVVYITNDIASSRAGGSARVLVGSTVLRTVNLQYATDATANALVQVTVMALHAPGSITPITFKTQADQQFDASATVFINRAENATFLRGNSYIKVTEFES